MKDHALERMLKYLPARALVPAQAVRELAQSVSIPLSINETLSVQRVLMATWILAQMAEHGGGLLGRWPARDFAQFFDGAMALGRSFGPRETAANDAAMAVINQAPERFTIPPLDPASVYEYTG